MSQHLGDVLSAVLDGELSRAELDAAQLHLAACAACAAELVVVGEGRRAIRSLPAVEPPAGFLERLLAVDDEPGREGPVAPVVLLRSRRMALANAAAAVAAGLLLVVGYGGHAAEAVSPEVTGSVEGHASTLRAVSAGLGGPDPIVAPDEVTATTMPRRSTNVPRPYVAPTELAGYRLAGAFQVPNGVHLLYEKGEFGLSVFEREGELDVDELPGNGTPIRVGGGDAWRWDGGTAAGRVIVLERGDLVFTVVGDESGAAVLAAASALPGSPEVALETRLRRACGEALGLLSPVG